MTGEPHLSMGHHNDAEWVMHAQALLTQHGFPGTKEPDGVFDQAMHDQVVQFQQHNGIHPTNGEVGDHTWAALGGITHVQGDNEAVAHRTAEDMQHIRNAVIEIAKRRLEFHFHEITRAVSDFHTHAVSESEKLGLDAEPDVFAFFEGVTAVLGYLFPEAELTKLVVEQAMHGFKAYVEATGKAAVAGAKKDILSLAEKLSESTSAAAQQSLVQAEAALGGGDDPATKALQQLDHLPQLHEQEWLEYVVTHFLGIPDPVHHSPYLWTREPLEEKLAMALARHAHIEKYGTPNTPFWKGQEQNHEIDAKVKVEVEYEHKGWHDPNDPRHPQHQQQHHQ